MRKILIIGTTGIGNFLLFLPALSILRKEYPQAKVDLLGFSHNGIDLNFCRRFGINQVTNIEHPKYMNNSKKKSKSGWFREHLRVILQLREQQYEISIMPFSGKTTPKLEIFNFLVGAKRRLLFSSNAFSRYLNPHSVFARPELSDVQQNLRLISRICKSCCNKLLYSYQAAIDQDEKEWASGYLKSLGIKEEDFLVGFQPVGKLAFNSARQWPLEKYIGLGNQLVKKYQAKCLLFGKTEEKSHLLTISKNIPGSEIILDLSLHYVAALISLLQLFVANDSALMHLAAMVGVPTIGIFGPTDPNRTAPTGNFAKVVRLDLQCSPCFDQDLSEKCIHRNCLTQLAINQVMKAIDNLFAQVGRN